MTDLEKELVRGIVKNAVSEAMNSGMTPEKIQRWLARVTQIAKKSKTTEGAMLEKRIQRFLEARTDREKDEIARDIDATIDKYGLENSNAKNAVKLDPNDPEWDEKYKEELKKITAKLPQDRKPGSGAIYKTKNAPSFEDIMKNPEAKKIVEAIEHGSSDKELMRDLKDKLFKKYGYKYVS